MSRIIDDLAGEMGIARRTLERRFRADLRQLPQKTYLELRIGRAVLRLRSTGDSITAIALACGFCDAPHLVRAIKAERGLTPMEYRRAQSAHAVRQYGPPPHSPA